MVTGGCLCGRCRFACDGEVGPANYCHCADCRRVTGSAFNVGVRLAAAGFRVIEGEPKAFTKAGGSGQPLSRWFCPDCGSPLYTTSPRHPEWVFAKASALDEPAVVAPAAEIWTCSEVSWARIPDGLTRHERNRS